MDHSFSLETLEPRLLLSAFVVDSLADSHDANPGDGVAQDSLGRTTLRAAIEESNYAWHIADTISFASGLNGTITLTEGELFIDSHLTLTGPGAEQLAIDANQNSRVIRTGYSINVSISDLTVTGGSVIDEHGGGILNRATLSLTDVVVTDNETVTDYRHGGGISCDYGSLSLLRTTVSHNRAGGVGGGIDDDHNPVTIEDSLITGNVADHDGGISSAGQLTIIDSTISYNTALSTGGIGLSYGAPGGPGHAVITGTQIIHNQSTQYVNGGIRAGGKQLTMTDCLIAHNIAHTAGGGMLFECQEFANVTDTVFYQNIAKDGGGGAIDVWGASDLSRKLNLTRVLIKENQAQNGDGGGIDSSYGNITIKDSALIVNGAFGTGYDGEGGAIYTSSGILNISNTTISNNVAMREGGGIFLRLASSKLISHNNTIAANFSPMGAGISSNDSDPELYNTIVAHNYQLDFATPYDVAGQFSSSSSHNLIGSINGSTGLANSSNIYGGAIYLDPGILPLNIDATLPYHALMEASPAIDAGQNLLATDSTGTPLGTDQLGNARISDGDANGTSIVDIGAVEASFAPGEIQGFVYDDLNGNGEYDSDESPVAGVLVYVDENNNANFDDGEPFAVTDSEGNYHILNVPAGSLSVRQITPEGYSQTAPITTSQPGLDTGFGDQGMTGLDMENSWSDTFPDVVTLSDGKILALADDQVLDQARVARLNSDGTLDTTFGTDGYINITYPNSSLPMTHAIAAYEDGRFVVLSGVGNDWGISRHLPDGSVDTSFAGGVNVYDIPRQGGSGMYGLVVQEDGKVVVSGRGYDGNTCMLVRFNANGSFDLTFGQAGIAEANFAADTSIRMWDMKRDDIGRFVVAGDIRFADGSYAMAAMRFLPDGTLDQDFGNNGWQTVSLPGLSLFANALSLGVDGSIFLAGYTLSGDDFGSENWAVACLDDDGQLDNTFSDDGIDSLDYQNLRDMAYDVVVQSDGKIVLAGEFFISGNGTDYGLARYHRDGTLDESFGVNGLLVLPPQPSTFEGITALDLQASGQLLAIGGIGDSVDVMKFNLGSPVYAHHIVVTSGQVVSGVNFANHYAAPAASADFNGDGQVSLLDFDILGRNFNTDYNDTAVMGDANGDGRVGLLDLDILGRNFNQPGTVQQGDFTGNGFVSLADLDILGRNFGLDATDTHTLGDANGDGAVDLLDLDILGKQYQSAAGHAAFHTLTDMLDDDEPAIGLF